MTDVKRQNARFVPLLLDDSRPVRIEDHRVLQRNPETLAEPEGHHDDLAQRNAKDVLFFRIVQVVVFEGPSFVDMLETCVEQHGLWDEEHLESVKQTLDQPLLVDEVACLNFRQVFVVRAALFPELLDVRGEDLIPGLRLFVTLIGESQLNVREIVGQVRRTQLLLLEQVSLLLALLSQLSQGPALHQLTSVLSRNHADFPRPLHSLLYLLPYVEYLRLSVGVSVLLDDEGGHTFGKLLN